MNLSNPNDLIASLFSSNNEVTNCTGDVNKIYNASLRQKIGRHLSKRLDAEFKGYVREDAQRSISMDDLLNFIANDFLIPLIEGRLIPEVKVYMEPCYGNDVSLETKFLYRAIQVVKAYLGDKTFGVEKLAKELFLSRAQLYRKLMATTGLSPNELINEVRLLRAAEKIRLNTDTVTQIGYSVGFSEQSYFAKKFRKRFGVTPREFGSSGAVGENMSMHML